MGTFQRNPRQFSAGVNEANVHLIKPFGTKKPQSD